MFEELFDPKHLISFLEMEQLKAIRDIKTKISLAVQINKANGKTADYATLITGHRDQKPHPIPKLHRNIYEIGAPLVTTNYDRFFDCCAAEMGHVRGEQGLGDGRPLSTSKPVAQGNVYFRREDFTVEKLEEPGCVIHLHGSLDDTGKMVVTTGDYFEHYQNEYVHTFLDELFKKYSVLFIGYGLQDQEIIQYILKARKEKEGENVIRHYWLYAAHLHQAQLIDHLSKYYAENHGVELLPYRIDDAGHKQLETIIEDWKPALSSAVKPLELVDMLELMEDPGVQGDA